nr:MAG TPA: hypothetical protein [Caudoviricetes sp.]
MESINTQELNRKGRRFGSCVFLCEDILLKNTLPS